jgi:hypothetical protein
MKSLNAKSMIVGVLLALLVVCVMGALPTGENDSWGRFAVHSHLKHIIILDTATGQIWMQYLTENGVLGPEGSPEMAGQFFGPKVYSDPNSPVY